MAGNKNKPRGRDLVVQGRSPLSARSLLAVRAGSPGTTASYRGGVRAWIAWTRENGRGLGAGDLAAYLEALRDAGAGPGPVNLALYAGKKALLQAAFRAGMAEREMAVLKTALDSLKGIRQEDPEVKVVSPAERAQLLAALPLRVRLVARTLYATGARVSELLAVRRDQVSVDGERARLRLVRTKGDRARQVRIPIALLDEIDAEYQGENRVHLFESKHGLPFSRQYITREISRAARRVLGRNVGAHQLRHSRATDLYQSTRRLKAVSVLLGHAGVDTTARYYVRDDFSDAELFNGETL